MAKRQTGWTEAKINRYLKAGRGKGELYNYKPWLTIQDVPSTGRVHRAVGWKTSRQHHLLSDLEFSYFCLCDWADDVIDIREQFPLDREMTMRMADEKGIKHPKDNKSSTPIVMTTDFFLVVNNNEKVNYKARTLKHSEDLNDKRTMEKFEIEREYWEKQGIDWAIVTEHEIPTNLIDNLKFIRHSFDTDIKDFNVFLTEWDKFAGELLPNLKYLDAKYNFEIGTSITLYKYALAKKILMVDMSKRITLHEDVQNIKLQKPSAMNKRWA
ncbi:TnsA endonuclease N-terminal domain-containing protein [Oceanobacillus sp. ISL-73]|uniref:TnsA endonuclease N-terminal domain-containing protein n=1 Tax=Oceanobacillus sp. ISL-73 TaxID=2819161 RepID=UPI001BE6D096|nr:TnsA endonuclease N-terminal domain-containing protein [Oceanobacillus sp. ISL-73]MBT2653242.1 TnsA endonuclease N-terminal domain-containing protein [Oceanobacillus sp. ISL-73]